MVSDSPEHGDVYQADEKTHNGYGMPRGPIAAGTLGQKSMPAIGFCPRCGTNARKTCYNRGVFDCPNCTHFWYDERVGKQTRTIDDCFSGGCDA